MLTMHRYSQNVNEPRPTLAREAGIRLTYPGGWKAELIYLGGWVHTETVYLSADSHPSM